VFPNPPLIRPFTPENHGFLVQRNIQTNGFDRSVHAVQAAASTRSTSSSLIVHDRSNNFGYAVLHKVLLRLKSSAISDVVLCKGAHTMPPSNTSSGATLPPNDVNASLLL
jgi:hypothetical protein